MEYEIDKWDLEDIDDKPLNKKNKEDLRMTREYCDEHEFYYGCQSCEPIWNKKTGDLEIFHPDRIASRILGMGDIAGLTEIANKSFNENDAKKLEKKIKGDDFDLNDLIDQMSQIKRMGSLTGLIEKIPGLSKKNIPSPSDSDGEKNLEKIEVIVNSMTEIERRKPGIIDGSRRRRIAKGSGTKPNDVNNLLNQFSQMKKMMKRMSKGNLKGMSMFR